MPSPRLDPRTYPDEIVDAFRRAAQGNRVVFEFNEWRQARNWKDYLHSVRRSFADNPRFVPKDGYLASRVKICWLEGSKEVVLEPKAWQTPTKVYQQTIRDGDSNAV